MNHSAKFILSILLLLTSSHLLAWGYEGHALVCDVAWRELTPATKQQVKAILKKDGRYNTFAAACNWADHIKGDKAFQWSKPWHYINLPRQAESVDLKRDCHDNACVVSAVTFYQERLQQALRSPQYDKKTFQYLAFLGHYVGDIHQPLHVCYGDDLGGNRVDVQFFTQKTNLHRVWDVDLVKRLSDLKVSQKRLDWMKVGKQLHSTISKKDKERWQGRGEAVQWANESYAVCSRQIYNQVGEHQNQYLQSYVDRHVPVIRVQLKKAGVRLAMMLNVMVENVSEKNNEKSGKN